MAILLALIVTVHAAATFLWIAPRNAISTALSGPLDRAMDPMFQQNWSLFAPTPINVANSLEVRALDVELAPTPWVDVTDLEISANFTHHLLPNRASLPTRMLAARAHAQFSKLSDAELEVLGGHYHQDAWPRLAEALEAVDGPSSQARLDLVIEYDRTMAAYATEFARATATGTEPAYVQFRVARVRVTPYIRRDEQSHDPSYYTFGRRPMYEFDRQDSDRFARAIERFQQ
ncbi:DUF5819 family protein [Isoptericola chiayiensis]|uniref:DUF5819 family protein n=1 Tax=Isoptericola chiayiensis TaxID=579446 RepID=UPI0015558913|nr:hypothetical protein [Isoptericola chiayiensis]